MGQEPNIELELGDAPRSAPAPAAPQPWFNERPGAITRPEDQPWGGSFGRPGPDTGFAIRLIRKTEWDRSHRSDETEAVLTTLVGARASHFGRAPVPEDVEIALILLGLRPDGLPDAVVEQLADRRERGLDHAAHEHTKGADLVSSIPMEHLSSKPDELRSLFA